MIRVSRSTRNQLASRAEPNLPANSVLTLGTSLRVPRHVMGFGLGHTGIFKHPLNGGCFCYGMTIRSCLMRSKRRFFGSRGTIWPWHFATIRS